MCMVMSGIERLNLYSIDPNNWSVSTQTPRLFYINAIMGEVLDNETVVGNYHVKSSLRTFFHEWRA